VVVKEPSRSLKHSFQFSAKEEALISALGWPGIPFLQIVNTAEQDRSPCAHPTRPEIMKVKLALVSTSLL